MKIYRNILILVWILCINIPLTGATTDFVVKKSSSSESTYWDHLVDTEIESQIDFQVSHILQAPGSQTYTIFLPPWFKYLSHNISWNCEIFSATSTYNSFFQYTIWTAQSSCIWILKIEYQILSLVPTKANISLTDENNIIIKSLRIDTTGNITITKAKTLDRNKNGFLDGYELTFSKNILDNTIDISNIFVGNTQVTGWNTKDTENDQIIEIYFPDDIFFSDELPQITSSGWNLANFVGPLQHNSVIEQDGASPVITKINNISLPISGNIAIGTGTFTFELSEIVTSNITSATQLFQSGTLIWWTYTASGKSITFTPINELWAGIYNFVFGNNITDLSENANILSNFDKNLMVTITRNIACSWLIANAKWNSVAEIAQLWNGTTGTPSQIGIYNTTPSATECRFICNTWYNWNGSACIAVSSWWWWGGWWGIFLPTCTQQNLQCTNGIYTIKQNNLCSGGDVWKICQSQDIVEQETETSNETEEIIPQKNYTDLQHIIDTTYSKQVQKIASQYIDIFNIQNVEYFLKIDTEFARQYQTALWMYEKLTNALHQYEKQKSQKLFQEIQTTALALEWFKTSIKNPIFKFVTIKSVDWYDVYVTTNKQISKGFTQIEKALLTKFKKQLATKVISIQEYQNIITQYNNFVLYISIYRYNRDLSIVPIIENSFLGLRNTYKKKLPKKSPPLLIANQKKVQDVYPLSSEQKLTNYNNEVKNLQNILKHFWYFEYEPTWYFGNTTNEVLKKFVEEKFNITYPWYLSQEIILQIQELQF